MYFCEYIYGFFGQKMIPSYYKISCKKEENYMRTIKNDYILPSKNNSPILHINTCGLQSFDDSLTVIRENGSKDFHLLYIKSGYCTVHFKSEIRKLRAGEFVFYFPNTKQKYIFPSSRSESYFLHFGGSSVEKILTALDLKEGFHKCNQFFHLYEKFDSLIVSSNKSLPRFSVHSISLLLDILYLVSEKKSDYDISNINNLINYITANHDKLIDFESIAKECGQSLHKMIISFKNQTGMTPKQFQEKTRIKIAKDYLVSSNINISKISKLVGYEDQLYFSRVFKRHTGLSPKNYRTNHSS